MGIDNRRVKRFMQVLINKGEARNRPLKVKWKSALNLYWLTEGLDTLRNPGKWRIVIKVYAKSIDDQLVSL